MACKHVEYVTKDKRGNLEHMFMNQYVQKRTRWVSRQRENRVWGMQEIRDGKKKQKGQVYED